MHAPCLCMHAASDPIHRYGNLVTPKPDAVSDGELLLSLLPVAPWP